MKKILIFCLLIGVHGTIYCQTDTTNTAEKKSTIGEKLFFGGDLGLLFGTTTLIDISPIIGVSLTENIAIGAGPIYQHYNFNSVSGRFSTTTYGGRLLGRYYFAQQFFAHLELQQLSLEVIDPFTFQLKRTLVPVGLVGGGYLQELGGNTYLNIQVLLDIIDDVNAPYASPIIRGGIIVNPF